MPHNSLLRNLSHFFMARGAKSRNSATPAALAEGPEREPIQGTLVEMEML